MTDQKTKVWLVLYYILNLIIPIPLILSFMILLVYGMMSLGGDDGGAILLFFVTLGMYVLLSILLLRKIKKWGYHVIAGLLTATISFFLIITFFKL